MISFTIEGQCVSLKNSRNIGINRKTGRRFPMKNAKLEAFEAAFHAQVPVEAKQALTGDVAVTVEVFYPSLRQDLDAAVVYDLLQHTGVIGNDRQVKEKREFWHLDPKRPRVHVIVREL